MVAGDLSPEATIIIGLVAGLILLLLIIIDHKTDILYSNDWSFLVFIVCGIVFVLFFFGGLVYYYNVYNPSAPGVHYGFELFTGV